MRADPSSLPELECGFAQQRRSVPSSGPAINKTNSIASLLHLPDLDTKRHRSLDELVVFCLFHFPSACERPWAVRALLRVMSTASSNALATGDLRRGRAPEHSCPRALSVDKLPDVCPTNRFCFRTRMKHLSHPTLLAPSTAPPHAIKETLF